MDSLPIRDAQQTMDVLYELSRLLNTGLDRETLSILVSLCEHGVNPEALAMVVKELKRETAALDAKKKTHEAEFEVGEPSK
mmetsp:Transcript_7258/g.9197  ORF Transcript_7258/g.9197 Transcript_7258/m.9197 type:complete len:81 (-) Transcript_7258:1153-1395(-)|eukprot:CAMPEP_0204827298 /NCGR_PEP_ID=MMETSP1346-20131115/4783_1 /ASSEMBLY_ACC=CAM_ASM_000771 /TAXON_ID=215587 /ORGANISM="Aplanochytrium stocchinoi, Strain GSBS06" /LENGTH=80 /DNA_ID=CAMNT_0051955655 /DNA_START=378 /DNA_END=620 /DNA_ORIENTATION=+